MPDFNFKILHNELLKRIDLYDKKSTLYTNFFYLLIESLTLTDNSVNFILKMDTINEKLKRIFINLFNIDKQACIAQQIYDELKQNFPKYLNKNFL